VGVFQTVEQAVLPQTAPNEKRTWLFSIYNTIANIAGAFGSLFAASVGFFASLGLQGADAYRPLFVLYAVIGIANLVIFITLSDKVELAQVEGERRFIGIHRSTGMVVKLSALFGLDAFAGGLVVPARQSYTMAVVDPDERTATAGITNVARTTASAVSPTFAGMAFSAAALSLPFFLAAGLKIVYDALVYLTFRNVHPPEEAEL